MIDPAYILFWDTSHVGDEGVTASLVEFEGSINVAAWMMTRPVTVPDRIYFEARFDTLRNLDYVDNDKGWPLMSERCARSCFISAAARDELERAKINGAKYWPLARISST